MRSVQHGATFLSTCSMTCSRRPYDPPEKTRARSWPFSFMLSIHGRPRPAGSERFPSLTALEARRPIRRAPKRRLSPMTRRALLAATTLLVSLPALAQTATKEKVAAALPKLKEFARQTIDRKLVPGLSIAIVQGDDVVFLEGFGVRQVGKPEAVDVDTVFQLASLSKPLASTVVAALVGDGKVSWDSRIRDIDPGFALYDDLATATVTVRDLFAHRSGLPGNLGNDIEELGFSQGEILQRLRLAKPAYSFRNGYSYSNFGLTEAAVAAARFAGRSWEEAAEEKLYKPLGMDSTSSRYRDFMIRTTRASRHGRVDGTWSSFTRRNADAKSP